MHASTEVVGFVLPVTDGAQRCALASIPCLAGEPVLPEAVIAEAACHAPAINARTIQRYRSVADRQHFH